MVLEYRMRPMKCINGILGLFVLAWFIVGNVWTFSISESQCNKHLYRTSFWYIIVVYIALGLGCCIGCCVGCCVGIAIAKKQDGATKI